MIKSFTFTTKSNRLNMRKIFFFLFIAFALTLAHSIQAYTATLDVSDGTLWADTGLYVSEGEVVTMDGDASWTIDNRQGYYFDANGDFGSYGNHRNLNDDTRSEERRVGKECRS